MLFCVVSRKTQTMLGRQKGWQPEKVIFGCFERFMPHIFCACVLRHRSQLLPLTSFPTFIASFRTAPMSVNVLDRSFRSLRVSESQNTPTSALKRPTPIIYSPLNGVKPSSVSSSLTQRPQIYQFQTQRFDLKMLRIVVHVLDSCSFRFRVFR